jgi:mono/diheme cytochrome c family protein
MAENNQDYNRGGFITFIFTMVFVLSFFIYLVTIHPGVDMGEKVQDLAASPVAEAPKVLDITTVKEPWIESAEVAQYGAQVYKANCTMCHGDKGLGDGAAGGALNPKPRNLVEGKWTVGGDSVALFNTLSNGITGTSMPGFGQIKVADRWALVQFIRSITQNKPADDTAKLNSFAASAK